MINPILSNDSARISQTLNRALEGQTIVINPGLYTITEDIEIVGKKELKIIAHGAKFKQAGTNKPLHFKDCSGCIIEGIELLGEGGTLTSGTQTSFTGISGIYATNPTDFSIYKTKVVGFLGSGIRWTGKAKNIHISRSVIKGVGKDFITGGSNGNDVAVGGYLTSEDINTKILDNEITGHAFGVFLTRPKDASIGDNYIYDIPGQHGLYIGHAQNTSVYDNKLKNCFLDAIKFQNTDGSTFSKGISVTDNKINSCGSGIEFNIVPTDGKFLGGFESSNISDNIIQKTKNYGIYTDGSINCIQDNNIVDGAEKAFGIINKYFSGSITNNHVGNTFWNAMYITTQNTVNISNNTIYNFVQSTVLPRTYRELYAIYLAKDPQNSGPDANIITNSNIFEGYYPSLHSCIRVGSGLVLHESASVNLTNQPLLET